MARNGKGKKGHPRRAPSMPDAGRKLPRGGATQQGVATSKAELLADLPDAVAGGLGKPWPDGTGAPGARAMAPSGPDDAERTYVASREAKLPGAQRGGPDCALCGKPVEPWPEGGGWGHNPQPLADPPARACTACNITKVIPARLGGRMPRRTDMDDAWEQLAAEVGTERDGDPRSLTARIVAAEGEDLAASQLHQAHHPLMPGGSGTLGQRMAAASTASQGGLPGAWQPGGSGQRIAQELTDALGNVYTPGEARPTSSVADVLAAERYRELDAQATEPGYRGGGELTAHGPPPGSYSGSTAPAVRVAADVAELRNWLVRQWQPGGLYYRATGQPVAMATNTDAGRAAFVDGERQQLQRAALYWVAPTMVDLTTTVAPSTPDDVRPVDLVWPDPVGLVVFATPVAGTDSLNGRSGLTALHDGEAGGGTPVQVDAICWATTRIPDASAPGGHSTCLSVSSYRMLDFDAGLGGDDLSLAIGSGAIAGARSGRVGTVVDGPQAGSPTMSLHGTIWAPLGRSDWPLLQHLGHQDSWIPDTAWGSFREDRQLVAALFTLLSDRQVLLADQAPAPMPRQQRRRVERDAARAGTKVRDVVVVTLRQPKRAHTPTDADTGRTYSHQWYSRPHLGWRACGPGRSERRLVPIRGSIKGPEGAPFIAKTRVNAWVK